MNATLTKWKIENIDTIEEFIRNIQLVNRVLPGIEWPDGAPQYTVTSNIDGQNDIIVQTVTIENVNYEYVSFNITVERAKRENKWHNEDGGLKDRKERINLYQSNMIAFVENGYISLITFSAKTTVKRIFNHAFDNEELKDIKEIPSLINEDLFYWILKRLRDYPTTNLHNTVNVNISGLCGYLGVDGSSDFRGNGRRVLAVLGTLAVIFSSDKLKSLRPEFQHNGNIVVVELNEENTVKVYEDDYMGNFNVYNGQEKSNVLALYIINILLPQILNAYNKNITDGLWSVELKLDFLRTIGEEIMGRVEEELKFLEENIQEEDDEAGLE